MPRYIDREQLLELINENCKYKNPTNEYTRGCNEVCDWAIKTIKNIPTADVQEVRHGKWIGYPSISISKRRRTVQSMIYKCSCCGKSNGRAKSPYCKNCGSKMCGDESEAKIEEVEEKK